MRFPVLLISAALVGGVAFLVRHYLRLPESTPVEAAEASAGPPAKPKARPAKRLETVPPPPPAPVVNPVVPKPAVKEVAREAPVPQVAPVLEPLEEEMVPEVIPAPAPEMVPQVAVAPAVVETVVPPQPPVEEMEPEPPTAEDVFHEARELLATDPLAAAQLASTLPAGRERTALVGDAFFALGQQNVAEAVRIAADTDDREIGLAAFTNAMVGGIESRQIAADRNVLERLMIVARAAVEGEQIPAAAVASALSIKDVVQTAGVRAASEKQMAAAMAWVGTVSGDRGAEYMQAMILNDRAAAARGVAP